MKKLIIALIVPILLSCINILNPSEVVKVAGGFNFTEGPAVDAEGNIYFTDIPNELILVWTINNELDTFRINSGRANGLYFDNKENLLTCESGNGRITLKSADGKIIAIASEYKGNPFNQPNDLWPDPKGGVYFTDPMYGNADNLPQDGMHVYYINPDHDSVIRVCDDYVKPNGIIGTPNGELLYITDHEGNKTFKYDIEENGTLSNKTLFVEVGGDGMTLDKEGNLYLTTNGKHAVDIFSPQGKLLRSISVPEKPSNVCFGGKDRNILFITARTSLYKIELNTKGVD